MATNSTNPTRRETLGFGLAAFAATAVAASPAKALVTIEGDTTAWDKAMAYFKHCEAAHLAYGPHHTAAEERHFKAVEALPHTTVQFPNGPVSTDNLQEVCWRRANLKGVRFLEPCAYDDHKASMELVAAADARNSAIAALRVSTGLDAIEERYEALVDRAYDARWDLLEMPAPHGEALLFKLEYFLAETHWSDSALAPTLSDMRRLLGGEA